MEHSPNQYQNPQNWYLRGSLINIDPGQQSTASRLFLPIFPEKSLISKQSLPVKNPPSIPYLPPQSTTPRARSKLNKVFRTESTTDELNYAVSNEDRVIRKVQQDSFASCQSRSIHSINQTLLRTIKFNLVQGFDFEKNREEENRTKRILQGLESHQESSQPSPRILLFDEDESEHQELLQEPVKRSDDSYPSFGDKDMSFRSNITKYQWSLEQARRMFLSRPAKKPWPSIYESPFKIVRTQNQAVFDTL